MKKFLLVAAAVTALSGLGGQAHAGLLGSTIDISYFFPDASTLVADPGARTVSNAIEYPAGFFPPLLGIQIDVTDSQIIITNTGPSFTFSNLGGVSFNGFIMTIGSGPTITNAVFFGPPIVDFGPTGGGITSGGLQLFINFEGVFVPTGPASTFIDVTTASSAVPEPSTWAMMLLGFAGLGFAFRQSRRKAAFA